MTRSEKSWGSQSSLPWMFQWGIARMLGEMASLCPKLRLSITYGTACTVEIAIAENAANRSGVDMMCMVVGAVALLRKVCICEYGDSV